MPVLNTNSRIPATHSMVSITSGEENGKGNGNSNRNQREQRCEARARGEVPFK